MFERVRFIFAITLATGCAGESNVFVERMWGDGPAVVVIVDHEDVSTPILIRGDQDLHEVSVDVRGDVRVYVRTYASLFERRLEDCKIFIGPGSGEPLGTATRSWTGAGDGGAIVFREETSPTTIDVRLANCEPPPVNCNVIAERIDTDPTYFSLGAVAAISDVDAMIMGGARAEDDMATLFLRASPEGVRELPAVSRFNGLGRGLVYDGEGVIGTLGRRVFRMDLDGAVTASTTVDFIVVEAKKGRDDVTFILGAGGEVFYIEKGALDPKPFEPAPPYRAIIAGVDLSIAVVDRHRLAVAGPDNTLHLFANGEWSVQIEDAYLDLVAIDDERLIAFQRTRPVIAKRDDETEWLNIGTDFRDQQATSVVSLPDGRFVVGGQDGILAYWNGTTLCRVFVATSRNIQEVDLAPSGKVAFAVFQNFEGTDMPTPIIRLTLP